MFLGLNSGQIIGIIITIDVNVSTVYPFMACLTVINMSKFDITLLSLLMMKLARDWKYCTVGWSDIAIFFENGHYAADQIYFYESN